MSSINPVNKSFCLERVCEANFLKLFRLIPDLKQIQDKATGYSNNKPDLQVRIIERAPYTLTVELSHCFGDSKIDELLEPAVKVRLYLDAHLAEVMHDHYRSHVSRVIKDPGQYADIMDYKWSLNYFLEKWLDHCLQINYCFVDETLATAIV